MASLNNVSALLYRYCVAASILLCLLFFLGTAQAANKPTAEPVTDLRILVDVSGSMKLNDPKNLRRDALNLLIGMLPKTSRAGIWSFGQYVNMQVKPDFATKEWKKNALKEASKVHSRGLFTNIEDTLIKSTWDWRKPDPKWDRHIILLTDGMVDISKQAAKNKNSRQKILGKILNELKQANVKIHTIALSSQADHELLKKLAKKSDGWYESADSADKLQRIFLRLFEKTTKMDSLPLEGNYFDVDKSISDMTLLVFRSKSGAETKIIRPDKSVFRKDEHPNNVEWYQDTSFDIITVHKPFFGKWKLDADVDRDNRVKVITNLKLRVSPLPNNVIKDEEVTIEASLISNDGPLNDKDLLRLIDVSLYRKNQQGIEAEQAIPATKKVGSYSVVMDGINEVGDLEVIVRAITPTFKRESRHEIKIHENPVNLELSSTVQGLIIKVTENPALIQTGTLQLSLNIQGQADSYYIPKDGAHSWKAIIDKSFEGKNITINVSANRIGNARFSSKLHGKLPDAIIPVLEPLTVWAEDTEAGLVVKAMLDENILREGTLKLEYFTANNDSDAIVINQQGLNLWQQLLLPEHSGQILMVKAMGISLNGDVFEKIYKVKVPEVIVKAPAEPVKLENKTDEISKQEEDPEKDAEVLEKEVVENEESSSNMILVIIIVAANILIFGGGYLGYRYWKRKNQPLTDEFIDEVKVGDVQGKPKVKEEVTTAAPIETTSFKGAGENATDEDFSSQRKEKSEPENISLDVVDETDSAAVAVSASNILDTSEADDLPEFDIDLDSDMEESVAEEPVADEPVAEEPVAEEPVADEPVADEPVAEEPVAEEPVADEPVAEEPVAEEPVADEPVAEEDPWAGALEEQADAEAAEKVEEDPWAGALEEQADAEAAEKVEEDPWAGALEEQADAEAAEKVEKDPWADALEEQADAEASAEKPADSDSINDEKK